MLCHLNDLPISYYLEFAVKDVSFADRKYRFVVEIFQARPNLGESPVKVATLIHVFGKVDLDK